MLPKVQMPLQVELKHFLNINIKVLLLLLQGPCSEGREEPGLPVGLLLHGGGRLHQRGGDGRPQHPVREAGGGGQVPGGQGVSLRKVMN